MDAVHGKDSEPYPLIVAAALRAAVDHVVPEQLGLMHPAARAEACAIRAELLSIATELEGPNA
jgi:hypothetical protein